MKKHRGFTLVETALAIGIVAFALLPIVGLLPLGLETSKQATDLTVSAQIAQRLAGMIQQADYSSYSSLMGNYYYFDVDGQPVPVNNDAFSPSVVYSACIFKQPAVSPSTPPYAPLDDSSASAFKIRIIFDAGHAFKGTPNDNTQLTAAVKRRTVTVPIYLANNGG